MRDARFWVGRLQFLGLGGADLREAFAECLARAEVVRDSRDSFWMLAHVAVWQGDTTALVGLLAKASKPELLLPDPEAHRLYRERLDRDVVDATAWFLVDLQTSAAAVEVVSGISRPLARETFCSVVNQSSMAQGLAAEIGLEELVERVAFEERLRALTKVQEVKAAVHRSNPTTSPAGLEIDRLLREMRARRIKVEIEAAEDEGLAVGHAFIQGNIALAVDGYGSATVYGLDRQHTRRRVSTRGRVHILEVQVEDDDPERTWVADLLAKVRQLVGHAGPAEEEQRGPSDTPREG
jgi:hypothetical protein